ncbi:hypothetical protein [Mucilaginibacter sp. BT774]|uniref:hypothetical protein n=1 Tax=Mucilaginibacter sp. BT774 TaxID=3062276 RepID=UPI00267494CA|nr:hypothetical protein [Mucilaginibacter sp. BT774]MDO3627918.1 hypothetical protein [Mucilaginibacter sp. BT774]
MKRLVPFFLLIIHVSVFAQSNYRPGYVVQSNGDTLKGFINYREWDRCPESIDFKFNPSDKQPSQFTPVNSKGFRVNGLDAYLTYNGPLSLNETDLHNLPDHLDTTKRQGTVFLKQLVTGKYITLYYHNDEIKIRFFIAEGNNPPIELMYYKYYTEAGGINHLDIYKGQLSLLISKLYPGNARLTRRVESTNYELSQLESLANEINGNKPGSNRSASRFFFGVAFNSTRVQINNVNYIDNPQSLTYLSPKINAGIDVFGNKNVQKYILRTELSFSYIKPRFNYSEDPHFNIKTISDIGYSFDQYTITATPQLLVNLYNKTNFKFYLDGGIGLNCSAYSNQVLNIKYTNAFNTVTTSSTADPYKLQSFWLTYPVQIGAVFNKVEVHLTYIAKTDYAPGAGSGKTQVTNQAINVGLKYLL